MKKGLIHSLILTLAFNPLAATAAKSPQNRTRAGFYSYALMDQETGRMIAEKDADQKIYPASLVKMMTFYIVCEELKNGRLKLDDKMKVSFYAVSRERTNLALANYRTSTRTVKLRNGKSKKVVTETPVSVRVKEVVVMDMIKALLVHSANDAAVIFAEHISGSQAAFVKRMNETAKRLGVNANFETPNGLPQPKQFATARGLAVLSRAAIRDFPEYYHFYSTLTFEFEGKTYNNFNTLLGRMNGIDGMKTGTTRLSKSNLAASMKCDEGGRVTAVVIGAPSASVRKTRMARLLEFGCDNLKDATLVFSPAKPSRAEQTELFRAKLPQLRQDDEETDFGLTPADALETSGTTETPGTPQTQSAAGLPKTAQKF